MFGSNRDLVNHRVPFAFMENLELCAILTPRRFGSNWDLVNHQVPFAFHSHLVSTEQFLFDFPIPIQP